MSALSNATAESRSGFSHRGRLRLPDPFRLDSGDSLLDCELHYSLTGTPDGPIVVVLGGISATRDVAAVDDGPGAGWWNRFAGPRCPVDTDRFRVLGMDWLGKHPSRMRQNGWAKGRGRRARPRNYPFITTRDQARALRLVLREVGASDVHTLIGSSYGGMVGLAFAAEFPDLVERLVVICAAHRTHPMATAHRVVQRRIVELAAAGGRAADGLALARALAMTTYRSIDEFEHRFAATATEIDGESCFAVEDYLTAQGAKFCSRITPEAFLCLSLSLDRHEIRPSRVGTPTDLVSVDTDTLVPAWLVDELEDGLAGPCRHHRIRSVYGHDAFLKEVDAIGQCLTAILDRTTVHDA